MSELNIRGRSNEYFIVEGVGAPELKIKTPVDKDIEGYFRDSQGRLWLDRRLTIEAVARLGLSPRTADLNIIGPDIVRIS